MRLPIASTNSPSSSPVPGAGSSPGNGAASASTMRIGELADRAGRTQRTLHFYEELGLLTPVGRTKGGFRLYDQDSLVRIHWITRLQDLGFSLPEIKDFLTDLRSAQSAPAMMESLATFYQQKQVETQARLQQLQALDAEFSAALSYLAGCRHCAPHTEKSACGGCEVDDHAEHEAPPLVAAVREPARDAFPNPRDGFPPPPHWPES